MTCPSQNFPGIGKSGLRHCGARRPQRSARGAEGSISDFRPRQVQCLAQAAKAERRGRLRGALPQASSAGCRGGRTAILLATLCSRPAVACSKSAMSSLGGPTIQKTWLRWYRDAGMKVLCAAMLQPLKLPVNPHPLTLLLHQRLVKCAAPTLSLLPRPRRRGMAAQALDLQAACGNCALAAARRLLVVLCPFLRVRSQVRQLHVRSELGARVN